MHTFSVWAPRAKSVAVKIGSGHAGEVHPMSPRSSDPIDAGWWSVDVGGAGHGTSYAFLLDDDPHAYPDPRSPWQPDGVHKSSRVYDHSIFNWTDDTWTHAADAEAQAASPLADAIIYELHLGTFTPEGTCDAAIARLDYLHHLGITHVELMPVAAAPGNFGWGYDGVAMFAPNEVYGGPDALKRLINACHSRGLGVLLDVVYNHFGPSGNYTGKFAPYLIDSHSTPWGGAVNFEDAGSHQVRRFYCDNAIMWLRDYHFDGLRLDAVHSFVDRSAIHFLEQLSVEIAELQAQLGRPLLLIAESDLNDPRIVTPRSARIVTPRSAGNGYRVEARGDGASGGNGCGGYGCGGYGMDAQWSDDFHHALFALLTGERSGYYADFGSVADLAKSLASAFVYDGAFSIYRNRAHGRPVEGLSSHRFLGFIQNHDQVGNRALGERLHQIVSLDRAKLAAALVLTSPFIPMIFQGEEFAASPPFQYFADHDDPELARAVSEGRRREFAAFGFKPEQVPDPEDLATFEHSKLPWQEVDSAKETAHTDMLKWYQALIRLRHSFADLRSECLISGAGSPGTGSPADSQKAEESSSGFRSFARNCAIDFDEQEKWLRMRRGAFTVLCNFGEASHALDIPHDAELMLANLAHRSGTRLSIEPCGVAIYKISDSSKSK